MDELVPENGWLHTSQLSMHYLDWNRPSEGPGPRGGTAVLALHGLASSCHWYDLVIPHLADTHRCIALDQRGHGQTDQPAHGYDWQSLATDVSEALDQLGLDKVAVLGHSWGGYVALNVAARCPERVAKLVMIDGGFIDWTLWPGGDLGMVQEHIKAEGRGRHTGGVSRRTPRPASRVLERAARGNRDVDGPSGDRRFGERHPATRQPRSGARGDVERASVHRLQPGAVPHPHRAGRTQTGQRGLGILPCTSRHGSGCPGGNHGL